MRKLGVVAVVAAVAIAWPAAARAANPLAAIPVGQSVNYHITTQSNSPQTGPQQTNNFVRVSRTAPNAFGVSIDGAPPLSVGVAPDGSVIAPPPVKKVLAPFGEMGVLLAGAPQPLAPNASWSAIIPVPAGGATDDIPMSVGVARFSQGGATITASGDNSTVVQPHVRSFPTGITVSATMNFNGYRILTSANGTVTIVVHMRLGRTKDYGSAWTVTQAGG